jgi:predicted dehydrogenase
MQPLRIGVVGVGNISGIYFKNLKAFPATEVVACADLDIERARTAAAEQGIPNALSPDELMSHPDVELVLNLTVPKVHGDVALQAVRAGKHVYNEKPLTTDRAQARELLDVAKQNGVLVGCAPDTFLGAGIQTARKAIDEGRIGEPIAAQAFMMGRGPEGWHPNPEFFYKPGGGPMLDMGPYYITALVNLVGGIKRVTGSTRATFPTRTIGSGQFAGQEIVVETPTHLTGVMDFENGAIGEITTSFDIWHTKGFQPITVYGSEGTILVPDPNNFGGEVLVKRSGETEWLPLPLEHGFSENSRGVGVLDMAYAARLGTQHRASGDLAYHVLDVMMSFQDASERGQHINLDSTVGRPPAMMVDQFADQR